MQKSPAGSFYRNIIRNAWTAVRDNPVLWIFGFFVSFLGNGGVYELLIQGTGRLGLEQDFGGFLAIAGLMPSGPEFWRAITGAQASTIILLLIIAGAVALVMIAVWAIVSSQGALIQGVRDAARKKKHTFDTLWRAGNEVVGPLLVLDVLSRLAISAIFYLLLSILVLLLVKATALSALAYLLGFLVLIPLTIIIGFVTIYAACYLTLHRMRLVEAVESAVALFLKHWLVSLETAVILFAFNVAVALVLGLALTLLAAVIFILYGLTMAATGAVAWIILLVGAVLAVGMIVVVGAGLGAFQYAVWTELFLKLNKGGATVAKIVRWFQKLF